VDETTLQNLNTLIDPADPLQPYVTLIVGVDVNDRGQILTFGVDSRISGDFHAYPASAIQPTAPEIELRGTARTGVTALLHPDCEAVCWSVVRDAERPMSA
jgi:hypothetical protein